MQGMTLSKLLKAAVSAGYTLVVYYDDIADIDYRGISVRKAKEALEACDCMNLAIVDVANKKRVGWAFIVTELGQDPEEQIADYSGVWMYKIMGDMQ